MIADLFRTGLRWFRSRLAWPRPSQARSDGAGTSLSAHRHEFADWPFPWPVDTGVFTTTRVLEDKLPVLMVSHDENGDWQFLCGTTNDSAHCRLICMGCALELDKTLVEVADLPTGWIAFRDRIGGPWNKAPEPDS